MENILKHFIHTKKYPMLLMTLLILSIFLLSFSRATSTFISVPFQANQEINLEITYNVNYQALSPYNSIFKIWIPRLKTWNSEDINQTAAVQTVNQLDIIPPDFYQKYSFDPSDVYGNSYDYYELEMKPMYDQTTFSYSAIYNVALQSRNWSIPMDLSLNDYNKSDSIYEFYTSPQPYYEINDTEVQTLASSITHNSTNIKKILESVYLFVEDSMNYTAMDEVLSLKEIIGNYQGDCSEFSTLMVGLLRTAGIPARKVLGISLIEGSLSEPIPKYDMRPGDQWSYSLESENVIPGHAWVQYYVPYLGWVSADPTWGKPYYAYGNESALQYLYQIDYLHLITTIGGWYEYDINPPLEILEVNSTGIPEFPFLFPIGNAQNYQLDFQIDFEVLSSTYVSGLYLDQNSWIILIITSSSFLIIVFLCFGSLYSRRHKRRNTNFFRN